jgi:hypothetical protein
MRRTQAATTARGIPADGVARADIPTDKPASQTKDIKQKYSTSNQPERKPLHD